MTVRWEELTEEGVTLVALSKPGSHIDCGNGGAPRGAWPCPARIWRNRHQCCGTRVDLETAGNFFPAGAESSLDCHGDFRSRLGVAPPARFHLSCSLPMRRFATYVAAAAHVPHRNKCSGAFTTRKEKGAATKTAPRVVLP